MKSQTFIDIIKTQEKETTAEVQKLNGCGVLVLQDGKILTGTRIGTNRPNTLCGPGGHVESGEEPEDAAIREAFEEFGIKCRNLKPLGIQDGGRRYGKSAVFLCTEYDGEPMADEEEMTDAVWRTPSELKEEKLFPPFEQSLELLDLSHPERPSVSKSENSQQFDIMKTDDDKRLIFGWASVAIKVDGEQVIDYQNDLVDPEDLEESVYAYVLNFRDGGEEHIAGLRKKARMVESCMFTKEKMKAMGIPEGIVPEGWWIGFYVDDDDAWEKVKNGTYQMFSIEGKGIREEIEEDEEEIEDFAKTSQNFAMSHEKRPTVEKAQTFEEILKFNPFHDARGRFSNANGFASYSANPKTKAGAMAIARSHAGGHGTTMNVHRESQGENINQNQAWLQGGPGAKILAAQGQLASQQPSKPKKNYDSKGFADQDDADFHQLYNGKQYYAQQNLNTAQKQAVTKYLEDMPEPGSLYSHSQNMNYMMANGQTLTGAYKKTHDGLMSSMHNLGYNVELTRYDHDEMLNSILKAQGVNKTCDKMSISQLKKALVGNTMNEDKFLSVSYNDFKNAPQSSKNVFTNRMVKITYKAKASTQAMMPGNGPGGSLGELIIAPTNGKSNPGGKIVDVKYSGNKARRKGTQTLNQKQIEIVIEI